MSKFIKIVSPWYWRSFFSFCLYFLYLLKYNILLIKVREKLGALERKCMLAKRSSKACGVEVFTDLFKVVADGIIQSLHLLPVTLTILVRFLFHVFPSAQCIELHSHVSQSLPCNILMIRSQTAK